MSTRAFNTAWLIERRGAVGHSTGTLAAHIAASAATVRAIESGANPDRYEYGLLARYAEGLGCSVDDLFERPVDDAAPDEVAAVVAALVAAGSAVDVDVLAECFDWAPDEMAGVLADAEPRLAAVGLALAWAGDGQVVLVPAAHAASPTEALERRTAEISGLTHSQAVVLAKLLRVGRLARTNDVVATAQLVDAGLAQNVNTSSESTSSTHGVRAAVELTDEACFNLCL